MRSHTSKSPEIRHDHIHFIRHARLAEGLRKLVLGRFSGNWRQAAYHEIEKLPVDNFIWLLGLDVIGGELCDIGFLWAEALKRENRVIVIAFDLGSDFSANPVLWNPEEVAGESMVEILASTLITLPPRQGPLAHQGRKYFAQCADWFRLGNHRGPAFDINKLSGFLELGLDWLAEGEPWPEIRTELEDRIIPRIAAIKSWEKRISQFISHLPDRHMSRDFTAFFAHLDYLRQLFQNRQPLPDPGKSDEIMSNLQAIQEHLDWLRRECHG